MRNWYCRSVEGIIWAVAHFDTIMNPQDSTSHYSAILRHNEKQKTEDLGRYLTGKCTENLDYG